MHEEDLAWAAQAYLGMYPQPHQHLALLCSVAAHGCQFSMSEHVSVASAKNWISLCEVVYWSTTPHCMLHVAYKYGFSTFKRTCHTGSNHACGWALQLLVHAVP